MAGLTIPLLSFTIAMELIIQASIWVVGGEYLKTGELLPPICAYIDAMTTLTSTVPCTKQPAGKALVNHKEGPNEV